MSYFTAETSAEPDRVVVALAGECDLVVRDELTAVLLAAVERAPSVFVDLSGLTFIDSSGLHGLVVAHHAALRGGGRLFVMNARDRVAALLDLTGVAELLSAPADDSGRTA